MTIGVVVGEGISTAPSSTLAVLPLGEAGVEIRLVWFGVRGWDWVRTLVDLTASTEGLHQEALADRKAGDRLGSLGHVVVDRQAVAARQEEGCFDEAAVFATDERV